MGLDGVSALSILCISFLVLFRFLFFFLRFLDFLFASGSELESDSLVDSSELELVESELDSEETLLLRFFVGFLVCLFF